MTGTGLSDQQLLREYAAKGSDEAFRQLVARHSRLVFSACFRALGDAHLAEDATQATFVVLSRKARAVKENAVLSDWLHRTAHYITADLRRRRARRARREQAAAAARPAVVDPEASRSSLAGFDPASWEEVRPLLDEELVALPASARQALVQHYLEGRSREEIAARTGCSLDAVRMRIKYGIDKLRRRLSRRGAGVSAAALAALLEARAAEAIPAGLEAGIAAAVAWKPAAGAAAATLPAVVLAERALALFFWAKVKLAAAALTAAAALAAAALSVAGAGGLWRPTSAARAAEPPAAASAPARPAEQAPVPAAAPVVPVPAAASAGAEPAAPPRAADGAKAPPAAQPEPLDAEVTRGALRFNGADGKAVECPLRHTGVKVAISGFLARVDVVQTFVNPSPEKIEAVYVFPLSHSGAVDAMNMRVGNRKVVGLIKRREAARQIYQAAVDAGKTAALLEQERPNIFTQSVGNIPPKGEVRVEISYVDVLEYDRGEYRFHFPMLVGHRYNPAGWSDPSFSGPMPRDMAPSARVSAAPGGGFRGAGGLDQARRPQAGGVDLLPSPLPPLLSDAARVNSPTACRVGPGTVASRKPASPGACGGPEAASGTDPQREARPALLTEGSPRPPETPASRVGDAQAPGALPAGETAGWRPGHEVSLELELDAGVPVREVRSVFHKVELRQTGERTATCAIAAADRVPNKDFELRYRVAGKKPELAVLAHASSGEDGSFMLMVQPADDEALRAAPPRELVFLVDVSGSMDGAPTEQVKKCLARLVRGVRPQDRIQLITFAGTPYNVFEKPRPATPENVKELLAYGDKYQAGGGTEMLPAIRKALGEGLENDRVRVVVMLTDGYVGNEAEIIKEAGARCGDRVRLWCLGIGNNVNRFLVDGVTRQGGGMGKVLALSAPEKEIEDLATEVMDRIGRAQLADIRIDWGGLDVRETYPTRIPELWAGRPVVVFGRYSGGGAARIRVEGSAEGRPVAFPVEVELPTTEPKHDVLGKVWARRKIEDLTDQVCIEGSPAVVEEITRLALQYRLMTRYTSFVAVDETPAEPGAKPAAPPRRVRVNLPVPVGGAGPEVFGLGEVRVEVAAVEGRAVANRVVPGKVSPETARRLFDERLYAEARVECERLLAQDPGNEEVRKLRELADAVQKVRKDRIRAMVQHLDEREQVKRQEHLIRLSDHVARARKLQDEALQAKGTGGLEGQLKKLREAEEHLTTAREIAKWMPAAVPVESYEREIAAASARGRELVEGRDLPGLKGAKTDEELAELKRQEADPARAPSAASAGKLDARQLQAMKDRAEYDYRQGRFAEAAAVCEQVLRFDPQSDYARALRDKSRQERHRADVLERCLDYAIEATGSPRAGEAAPAAGQDEALARRARMLNDKARMLYERGDYEEAGRAARRVLEMDPTNADAVALEKQSRVKAVDKRAKTADISKEAIKDWVELSKRAGIPHSRLLVYPSNWEDIRRRIERGEGTIGKLVNDSTANRGSWNGEAWVYWGAAQTDGLPGLAVEDCQTTDWDGYRDDDADDGEPETDRGVPFITNLAVLGRAFGNPYRRYYSSPDDASSPEAQTEGRIWSPNGSGSFRAPYAKECIPPYPTGIGRRCMEERDVLLLDAHRDRRRVSEELANAEYVVDQLRKSGQNLPAVTGATAQERLASAEYILSRTVQDGVDISKYGSVAALPDVRTKVVDVRPNSGYVAIGAGKGSGIREGHVFLVHRGKEYLGKVRVTTVWDSFSGGTVVERKKPFQAGDDAMTDTAPTEEAGVPAAKPGAEPEPTKALREKLEKKLSFKFVDQPLEKVIEKLSAETGVTMAVDPALKLAREKKITLGLTDGSGLVAVDLVARLCGLEYRIEEAGVSFGLPAPAEDSSSAPKRVRLGFKSFTPEQRGRIVLGALDEALLDEMLAEAKADDSRTQRLLDVAKALERRGEADAARRQLQLIWLFDSARARLGVSKGEAAGQALARLAEIEKQAGEVQAKDKRLKTELKIAMHNCSLVEALARAAEAADLKATVAPGALEDAASMAGVKDLRVVYRDLSGLTLAAALDVLAAGTVLEWRAGPDGIEVTTSRRDGAPAPWTYEVSLAAVPDLDEVVREGAEADLARSAGGLAAEFLNAVRAEAGAGPREHCFWLAPGKLVVHADAAGHRRVGELLAALESGRGGGALSSVVAARLGKRRDARRKLEAEAEEAEGRRLAGLAGSASLRLLVAAAGGKPDVQSLAWLAEAWRLPASRRLLEAETGVGAARSAWAVSEACLRLKDDADLAALGRTALAHAEAAAQSALKTLEEAPCPEARLEAFYGVLALGNAGRLGLGGGEGFGKCRARLLKLLPAGDQDVDGLGAVAAALLVDRPDERAAKALLERAGSLSGDDLNLLAALAARRAGGQAWQRFRALASGTFRDRGISESLVLLVSRLDATQ